MAAHVQLMASHQRPDGRWQTWDNRPPQSHSPFTDTAHCLRALQLYMPVSRKAETDDRVRRARDWLLADRPAETTYRANRLLGLRWSGADDRAIREARMTATSPRRRGVRSS